MRICLIEDDNDKLFGAYFCCIRKKRVEKKYVYMQFVGSNESDWSMTTVTPSSSDQIAYHLVSSNHSVQSKLG